MNNRPATTTLTFESYEGRPVKREIRHTLDIRDCLGMRGYPWLVIAANPHLSLFDLLIYLEHVNNTTPGVQRSRSWIQRRRKWLFQLPGQRPSPTHNPDGQHARAIRIMAEHTNLSVRQLVQVLKEHGITRGREWVRNHRCEGLE